MNFSDYFTKGLRNTLKFKNGINWSFKGTELQVPTTTLIDQWFVGEFSTASYEIVAEYGHDDVERLTLNVTAKVGQVSIVDNGRSNLGKDLVYFTATIDNSRVTVYANPYYQADGVTPLVNVKITFQAKYTERLIPAAIPSITGQSSNSGGQAGIAQNYNGTPFGNGFLSLDDNGYIAVSNFTSVTVPTQQPLVAGFIFEGLAIQNTDTTFAITTDAVTNTINISLDHLKGLVTTGTITANLVGTSTINNVTIGATTPRSGKFTSPVVIGSASFVPFNTDVTITPTGTGSVNINPAVAGTINNANIGSATARSATFTSLDITASTFGSNDLVNRSYIISTIIRGAI
jgi:hypothetical protein